MEVQQDLLSGIFARFLVLALLFSQAQFLLPQAAFPPPFRWIFYIAKLTYKKKKSGSKEDCDVLEKNKVNNLKNLKNEEQVHFVFQVWKRKAEYFACLKEVIEAKQQKDRERTTDDNHRDFKNDLLEDFGRILNSQSYAEI